MQLDIKYASYYNHSTHISLMVPSEWTGKEINERQFRIFGPIESQYNDYRSTMSYFMGKPDSFESTWFDLAIATSNQEMQADYNGYILVSENQNKIAGRRAYTKRYEWKDQESGLHFSQIQSLIYASPLVFYSINAATLKELEGKYLDVFLSILRSTRIIPMK